MTRGTSLGLISGFTAEQWGMVTAAQARSVGVSRVDIARLVADSALEPVHGAPRVYRLTGAPPDPDLDGIRAAWLQLGDARPGSVRLRSPDAVAAGRSAAVALRLGDLQPAAFEFLVDRRRQLRRPDVRLRVERQLPRIDWTTTDNLPVATVPRLVADLLSTDEDGPAVARVCQDAAARGLIDAPVLERVAAPHAARYGAPSPAEFAADLLGQRSTRAGRKRPDRRTTDSDMFRSNSETTSSQRRLSHETQNQIEFSAMTARRASRSRTAARATLWSLASGRSGYFTAAQARNTGYSYQAQHYHAQHGNWICVDRGIYRFREFETLPCGEHDHLARWALWSKDRAVVSHATALSVHDLGTANPSKIHLTVPPDFRQLDGTVVLHRAVLAGDEVERHEGYWVTTPVRAVAESAAAQADQDVVTSAVAEGLDRGLFTRQQLLRSAERLGARAELGVERALRQLA